MGIIIPQWFYGIDSLVSVISALIGFAVSFNFFKLQRMSKSRNHLFLHYGFALLSMSLLLTGVVSGFSYMRHLYPTPTETNVLGLFDEVVSIEDVAMWIYYISSIVAYLTFLVAYKPREEDDDFAILLLPVWTIGYKSFHMLSIFILSYVVFRAWINYSMHKNKSSGLVLFAFVCMWIYHLLLFMTSFSGMSYVAAHVSLIVGFSAFWLMLRSVQKK